MKKKPFHWEETNIWGMKELTILLLIEFIVVIGCIKFVLSPLLMHLFKNELYAGVFTGVLMAFVLIGSTYIIALRPKSLSWMELGDTPFKKRDGKMSLLITLAAIMRLIIIAIDRSLLGGTWENEKTDAL